MRNQAPLAILLLAAATVLAPAHAAGTLAPSDGSKAAPEIRAHEVHVTVLDGFARTQVDQTFHNSTEQTIEGIYTCPVPVDGSLSELSIQIGERTLEGEVLPRAKAQSIYEEQKAAGRDSALGTQEGYERYEFRVAAIPPGGDVKVEYVYYQPIAIDTGVGRYVYPLAEGGNETAARSFWNRDPKLHGPFTFDLELRTSWPVEDVRVAGYEKESTTNRKGDGEYQISLSRTDASLDRDVVVYYRLKDDLPGRLEMTAYRDKAGDPGTFMLVLTPGVDLAPITGGADYCFVLDVSGSMQPHLAAMTQGIVESLQHLNPNDRFRIVAFNSEASEVTDGWRNATQDEVTRAQERLRNAQANGGTNVYAGLSLGLAKLEADRATNVILDTDGVANEGVLDPKKFRDLMHRDDLRVFTFIVGGEANWPLMRIVGEASGGVVTGVSDADDVLGQVTLAREKVAYEALHDVELSISGVNVSSLNGAAVPKVYRGQQMVLFGRYERGGDADITLKAKLTGEDRTYRTRVHFPDVDEDTPELERLWALQRIHSMERERDLGLGEGENGDEAITKLGVDYQLVTAQTAMLVLDDAEFDRRGIARSNRERTQRERAAQQTRLAQQPVSRRVDAQQPMFDRPAASSHGGGAMEPWTMLAGLALATCAWLARRGGVRS